MFEDLRAKVHEMIADIYAAQVRSINADIIWHRHRAANLAQRAIAITVLQKRRRAAAKPPPET